MSKVLGVGCGVVCLLLAAGAAFIYRTLIAPALALQSLGEAEEESAVALAALDARDPWRTCRGAETRLEPADIDSYLVVRQSLAPELTAMARTLAVVSEHDQRFSDAEAGPGAGLSFRERLSAVSETMRADLVHQQARRDGRMALLAVLEGERMGPRMLQERMEAIERRFLRNPAAMAMGLSTRDRERLESGQAKAASLERRRNGTGGERDDQPHGKALAAELAATRAELAALEQKSLEDLELPAETTALLATTRSELEALGAEELATLRSELETILRQAAMAESLDRMKAAFLGER